MRNSDPTQEGKEKNKTKKAKVKNLLTSIFPTHFDLQVTSKPPCKTLLPPSTQSSEHCEGFLVPNSNSAERALQLQRNAKSRRRQAEQTAGGSHKGRLGRDCSPILQRT